MLRLYETSAGRRFAYDGGTIVAEYDTGDALQARHVFGSNPDEVLVTIDAGGNRSWLIADERGSIVAKTDASGAATAIMAYDEYGIPSGSDVGRFRYTGQAWLPELGFQYYKARMYSPTLGRFLQTDPIGYADGMNLYAYVKNDPVNWTDLMGLSQWCETVKIGNSGITYSSDGTPQPWVEGKYQHRCGGDVGSPDGKGGGGQGKPQNTHQFDLTVVTQCPAGRAFEAVRAAGNSAPGAPYARAGPHDVFLSDIFPWRENLITQTVDVRNRTITNVTGEGHRFHPGSVTITVNDLGGNYSSIHIVGTGSGATPEFNNFIGGTFFGGMAYAVADYCKAASGYPNIKN